MDQPTSPARRARAPAPAAAPGRCRSCTRPACTCGPPGGSWRLASKYQVGHPLGLGGPERERQEHPGDALPGRSARRRIGPRGQGSDAEQALDAIEALIRDRINREEDVLRVRHGNRQASPPAPAWPSGRPSSSRPRARASRASTSCPTKSTARSSASTRPWPRSRREIAELGEKLRQQARRRDTRPPTSSRSTATRSRTPSSASRSSPSSPTACSRPSTPPPRSSAATASRSRNPATPISLQRARDFEDIEQRLLRNLLGRRREDLEPSQGRRSSSSRATWPPRRPPGLDRENVLALATEGGGRTSHTAILARALGIPAVVGVPGLQRPGRRRRHGDRGRRPRRGDRRSPTTLTRRRYEALGHSREAIEERIAAEFCNLPAVTRDGRRIAHRGEHRVPQRSPRHLPARRGRRRPLPDGVPLPHRAEPARRGGAFPGVHGSRPGARRPPDDHPHPRHGRGQVPLPASRSATPSSAAAPCACSASTRKSSAARSAPSCAPPPWAKSASCSR